MQIIILENQLLLTLSHFEPMSLEKIFLDIDQSFVLDHPELSRSDLLKCLEGLVKKKLIKKSGQNKEAQWIKLFQKRKNILQKLWSQF